ncbi:glycosyltransferase family 2 protein [Tolypothrix sp. LEGE 11397]|uniref:glycosyltransferase family 2 protein n=1 Tax=unclassified Tolypothrix TaxID=2649714 RepID=UPI0005F7F028|nr:MULTISPECIES: glycosyltransferase family 2 protein [unclassified Tolypothrix]MBE9085851.1 glycosyltransferase family 2 protein [Tolypothrix sp. LEGE 11397]UYD29967.1 glycosyltransferase family 2 protein [Tolypothrix sp. PCC 7712]UYD37575.1 glycosyltransferase family 2 protein [Tolypothrix sp. PCC 7601]
MNSVMFAPIPEISIVLCTYNRAKYLNKCIDSIINQTFQDWELIVVDDGSEDNTFEIVNIYVQKFNNIRYFKHKNRKPGYARNAGIQASFGKYITFIDSDDAYQPNHLESRLEYMKAHPDLDLIEGGFATEEDIWVVDYFNQDQTINLKECVVGPTFFGKRNVFFELKGFNDIPYVEDTEFWCRAEKVFKTEKLTEPQTYLYTRGETSVTKSFLETISSSS